MNADGADELENEVVYMEESAASFRASERPLEIHPRSAEHREGPSRKIFGGTPSGDSRSRPSDQFNIWVNSRAENSMLLDNTDHLFILLLFAESRRRIRLQH